MEEKIRMEVKILKRNFKKKSMSVKEKFLYFWNVVLGPDIQDGDNIKDKKIDEAFSETEAKLDSLKDKYFGVNNKAGKAGKGGKSNKLDVPTVTIDTKAVEKTQKSKAQKASKKQDVEIEK